MTKKKKKTKQQGERKKNIPPKDHKRENIIEENLTNHFLSEMSIKFPSTILNTKKYIHI